MRASLQEKLARTAGRYHELAQMLGQTEIIADQNQFRALSKEYAQLEPIVLCFEQYTAATAAIESAKTLMEDEDASIQAMAADELADAQGQATALEEQLQILLLPQDPNDKRNIFIEIRAGTGGSEAGIFVGDLFRMYSRYTELKNWQLEVMSENSSEHGGYKEVIIKISGQDVYGHLKFESGAHRVQRVPETESQGRVHTSACTVAVMPEVEAIAEVEITPDELRVDTFRASGAGGQHVNKTDSAIRLTHLPTGIVVECQDERSQHKNRARALSLLQSKILSGQQAKQQQEQAETRRNLVGSGDRSERIRTYNYPQGRVTDHRINLTLYQLAQMMEGELDQVIEPLIREHQADQLAAFGDD